MCHETYLSLDMLVQDRSGLNVSGPLSFGRRLMSPQTTRQTRGGSMRRRDLVAF